MNPLHLDNAVFLINVNGNIPGVMNNQQIANRVYFIHILIFADNLKNMHDN